MGPTFQDAAGLLVCGEGWALILHPEMNYFSLTSNAELRASFLRVMGSILSPAVFWGQETFLSFMQQLVGESTCWGIPLLGVLLLVL